MAGLLAAWRGALVRAARCRAGIVAAREYQSEASARETHPLAKRPCPALARRACGSSSLTLRVSVALALVYCLGSVAHAQWPWSGFFRPSSEAKVVSTTPHPAIARVSVQEKDGISFGTGSLVDARGQFGLVITNWHVVRDATGEVSVEFPGGFRTPGKILKVDADWDLAALEIARPVGVQPLAISSALPRMQENLVIAGYGAGNYRAAAGACQQYLAPKEGMPFEMVEVSAEARQGDSGGPILNERGEIAGVLFGAGHGFTAGSYGGRVLGFLASVVPDGRPGSDMPAGLNPNAMAQSPTPSLSPTADHVPRTDPFAALAPQVQDQLQAMAQPPAGGRVPRNVLAPSPTDASPELALVPLPSRRSLPVTRPPEPGRPSRLEVDRSSITPLAPPQVAGSAHEASPDLTPPPASITPAEGPPSSASLKPRKGAADTQPSSLQQAPADQLLAAAWKQIGGTTLVDQVKTVLAAFGVLGIFVVVWRLVSRDDREDEAE